MHGNWWRIVQGLLILIIVCSFAVVTVARQKNVLVISSPLVEILEPHPHDEGDSADDTGHGILFDSSITVPEEVWVTEINVELKNAPSPVLHHLVLSSEQGPDSECPGTSHVRDYIAVGEDTPKYFTFEEPYGMRIEKGTVLNLSTMLHNPERPGEQGKTYKNVQAVVKLTTVNSTNERTKNIELLRIAVQDTPYCSKDPKGPGFSVPPNTETFVKTPEKNKDRGRFMANTPGTIIGGYAHMHGWDGGKSVSLYINDEVTMTWKTHEVSEINSSSASWETPQKHLRVDIRKGDVLSVSSEYANLRSEATRNAMGAARLFYYPEINR